MPDRTRGGELAFELIEELQRGHTQSRSRSYDSDSYARHHLYLLQDRFANLHAFLQSREAVTANTKALLLVGDAGTGETHLFCEIARERLAAGAPTLLFLGEQFVPGEPWSQMFTILGIRCDREEFLGALEAAAEAHETRALLLLDAINEEHGPEIWLKHIAGMVTQIGRYPRVAIALSVRTSYESAVIRPQLVQSGTLVRFVHSGFAGHEEEGVDRYLAYYGIAPASLPTLDPEFSNPLFLRVLCEGVRNRGLARIPEGLRGFTSVFEFFLDSINDKLARADLLDFDPQTPVVMQAVRSLVAAMVEKQTHWLERGEASRLLDSVLRRQGFDRSLFRRLVDEGVLSAEVIRVRSKGRSSGTVSSIQMVRFQYQRFADYLIVQHVLRPHIAAGRPQAAFESGQYLAKVLANPTSCMKNQGLVEALAVVLPETTGRELPQFVPHCASFSSIRQAISGSLAWRRTGSISAETWAYIEAEILPDADARRLLLRTLLLVAPDPAHPYNADFLHQWLFAMPMAKRDAIWSTFLGFDYASGGSTARILRWVQSTPSDRQDSAVARLTARALAWTLTSSTRPLRDGATKALVRLLSPRVPLASELIKEFGAVNDDYVLERIAAAGYGAAMRSRQIESVAALAKTCYETFFEETDRR